MTLVLRAAKLSDLPTLQAWDEAPHVQGTGGDEEWNDWDWANQLGRNVPWRDMLVSEIDNRPIGFIQIIDCREEETHYWGTDCPEHSRAIDIWIGEVDAIGKGYGREMMRQALARCFSDPAVTDVLIDPLETNTKAHRFYEAIGFSSKGPRMFGPDKCLIFQLTRADWRKGNQNA